MTYWLTENSTVPMITGAILVVILLFMAYWPSLLYSSVF